MKVAVAMSGGVDSSVAALLLKNEGYDLFGLTLNVLDDEQDRANIISAAAICKQLQIPHHVIDIKDKFADTVIKNFCEEYSKGRTPNPCVFCNHIIKFGALFESAKLFGAQKMATGHYVQIQFDESLKKHILLKGVDANKDQTYFLWRLTTEQLARAIFPIGKFKKAEIRQMAEKYNLHTSKKKESQEVCFMRNENLETFLKSRIKSERGDILTVDGKKIGKHRGHIFYTIGQRRRLGIALGKPAYVIKIDADKNQIIIGDNSQLFRKELTASKTNWISVSELDGKLKVCAKIRYRTPPKQATIEPINNGKIKVTFDEPQRAITPGQSVVFYDGQKVVGGGIID